MTSVKIEVEIDLEDFFNSDNQRAAVFQEALQNALTAKLNDASWFEQNVAHFLYKELKREVLTNEISRLEAAVKDILATYKVKEWDVQRNEVTLVAIREALDEFAPEIKERTKQLAKDYMADENRTYPSFYNCVADQCVSRVFDHFVSAMVKQENEK